jgi:hypothetical protein
VGPACHALIRALFGDQVLVNLRAAQGVLRLGQTYGEGRLEAACERALGFGSPRYRTVKTILAKGLDHAAEPAFPLSPSDTYAQGGRFCRDPNALFH